MTTVKQQLAHLEGAGLVRLTPAQAELAYLFRHVLVQEAAYDSLLRADRKQLHRAVGEALEQSAAGQLDEAAPVLGRHFLLAGEMAHALRYFTLAGDRAAQRYANAEAVIHYTSALEAAPQVPATSAEWLALYQRRGRALELCGRHDDARADYEALEALGRERGEADLELAGLIARATIYATLTPLNDRARGQALAEQALALARARGARPAEARILWTLLLVHGVAGAGDLTTATAYGEQARDLARGLGMRELLGQTLNDLATYCYTFSGQREKARAALAEAREIWRDLGNLPLLAENRNSAGLSAYLAGEYDQALAALQEAYETSRTIANRWGQAQSACFQGLIYAERAEAEQAIALLNEGVQCGHEVGFLGGEGIGLAGLMLLYAALGAADEVRATAQRSFAVGEGRLAPARAAASLALALAHLLTGDIPAAEQALAAAPPTPDREPPPLNVMRAVAVAEIGLAQQDYAAVLAYTDLSLAGMRQIGFNPFVAAVLCYQGEALLGLGRLEDAGAVLAEAQAHAAALGDRLVHWRILAARARLAAQAGRAAEAQAWREQARAAVAEVIARIGAPDLQTSFRALPAVQALG